MTLVASDLIDDAILGAYPHGHEENVARGPLLRALSNHDMSLVRDLAIHAPTMLAQQGATFSVEPTLNLTGYSLSAALAYVGFVYILDDGSTVPLRIIPESYMDFTDVHPSGVVRLSGSNAEFFPSDPFNKRWETTTGRGYFSDENHQVGYRYVAPPTKLTALGDALGSPDEARDVLQLLLVTTVLSQVGAPQEKMAGALSEALAARRDFMLMAMKRPSTTSSVAGLPSISGVSEEWRIISQ